MADRVNLGGAQLDINTKEVSTAPVNTGGIAMGEAFGNLAEAVDLNNNASFRMRLQQRLAEEQKQKRITAKQQAVDIVSRGLSSMYENAQAEAEAQGKNFNPAAWGVRARLASMNVLATIPNLDPSDMNDLVSYTKDIIGEANKNYHHIDKNGAIIINPVFGTINEFQVSPEQQDYNLLTTVNEKFANSAPGHMNVILSLRKQGRNVEADKLQAQLISEVYQAERAEIALKMVNLQNARMSLGERVSKQRLESAGTEYFTTKVTSVANKINSIQELVKNRVISSDEGVALINSYAQDVISDPNLIKLTAASGKSITEVQNYIGKMLDNGKKILEGSDPVKLGVTASTQDILIAKNDLELRKIYVEQGGMDAVSDPVLVGLTARKLAATGANEAFMMNLLPQQYFEGPLGMAVRALVKDGSLSPAARDAHIVSNLKTPAELKNSIAYVHKQIKLLNADEKTTALQSLEEGFFPWHVPPYLKMIISTPVFQENLLKDTELVNNVQTVLMEFKRTIEPKAKEGNVKAQELLKDVAEVEKLLRNTTKGTKKKALLEDNE